MRRAIAAALVLLNFVCARSVSAEDKYDAQWIWYDAGNPAESAPPGKVWLRREVRASEPSTGAARILCDDRFVLWVNGKKVGAGEAGKIYRFNLNGIVERGPNVIAVEAENLGGKAGLFVDGEVRSQGGDSISFDTGATWSATITPPEGEAWKAPQFDARGWKPVKLLGSHAQSAWKSFAIKSSYLDQFDVPEGFELIRIAEPSLVGSLVAMTWGYRGRLIVSKEHGPILSAVDDDGNGTYDRVIEYSKAVTNCQGLCMVGDDLYAAGNGPKGVGIYRLPDKNHDDVADAAELVMHHKGGMGDHGPHDIVFGPDGWLYHNMGNHAWNLQKPEPTTACRNYDEDYLLTPKFEDANGHASGIKAPGGTIWRFTPDGKRWWCETNGFRNEYDIAFNSAGDLFSFDSDMEWDVGAPWYRPIRVNHCTAGAEFGWRSGAAKWPAYYFDSLPGTVDIGRGSPTGVVFYEHTQYPAKYRGSFLICDWSMGRILAVHLKKEGASFQGSFDTLLSGNPLNVSDIEVDRDGSMVFVTGGRGTQGGVYRLRYKDGGTKPAEAASVADLLLLPQFESAWAREIAARVKAAAGPRWEAELKAAAVADAPESQIRALTLLNQLGPKPDADLVIQVSKAKDATVRAFATHLLGFHGGNDVAAALAQRLSDADLAVRRRACEAFVRSGIESPVDPLLRALGSPDRWLRFAARLALERIPRDKWFTEAMSSPNYHVLTEALLATYRLDRTGSGQMILVNIARPLLYRQDAMTPEMKLIALRLTQLALVSKQRTPCSNEIGKNLLASFPTGDKQVDKETARILAALDLDGAVAKILSLVEKSPDHGDQLHYALTLRYLNAGWTFDFKRRLMEWYEGTRTWEGGNSLSGYVSNVVGATTEQFTPADRKYFVQQWPKLPAAAALVLRVSDADRIADFESILIAAIEESGRESRTGQEEFISAAIASLGKSDAKTARDTLRKLYEQYPDRREALARAIAEKPAPDDWPLLVRTLQFADSTTIQLCLGALDRLQRKADESEAYRAVIQSGLKLGMSGGLGAVKLLRTWSGAHDGGGDDALKGIAFYQKWYATKFPTAPAPELAKEDAAKSKYTFQQLSDLLNVETHGNVDRGRVVFTKAKCVKCHRFQNEGEGVGPDLTSVRRRFQRKEIVESIVHPSQVISDQYRMVQVQTQNGQVYVGMPIPGVSKKGTLVLLLADTTKLELSKKDIEEKTPSKISVMPTGLLDALTKEEIADLFAFLETSKFNAPVADASKK